MRKMKFKVCNSDNFGLSEVYNDIEVKYSETDKCLCTPQGNCDGMLGVGGTGVILCFDIESKRVGGVTGYIGDLEKVEAVDVPEIIKYRDGLLLLDSSEVFAKGIAYEFDFHGLAKCDVKRKSMILGQFNFSQEIYRVLKNVYIQLDKNGALEAIMVKNFCD